MTSPSRGGGDAPYPLITLSAAYGAGGSVVGPGVAEALGVPFHDRAIPAAVAAQLGVDVDSVEAHDGRAERGLARLVRAAAWLPGSTIGGMETLVTDTRIVDETLVADRIASLVRSIADGAHAEGGGVLLGRAGAAVLAGRPDAFHIRLHGPPDARIAQARRLRGLSEKTARNRLNDNDVAREAYVKRLYGRDPRNPGLYDLMLDSTSISLEDCVALITFAVTQRRSALLEKSASTPATPEHAHST